MSIMIHGSTIVFLSALLLPMVADGSALVREERKSMVRREADLVEEQGKPNKASANGGEVYRQTLQNYGDAQFTAHITVGGQPLRGILDTGSFELVVLGNKCDSCRSDVTKLYSAEASHTHLAGTHETQHAYGSGTLRDREAYDNVKIGPLHSKNQSFWEVTKAAMPILRMATFEAIVGVGPAGSAKAMLREEEKQLKVLKKELQDRGRSLPESLGKAQQHIHDTEQAQKHMTPLVQRLGGGVSQFSVCIGKEKGSAGYFTWNDNQHLKNPSAFKAIDVVGTVHWGLRLQGVALGSHKGSPEVHLGCGSSCGAIIDSGTTLIAAPREVLAKVSRHLVNNKLDCSNLHNLPDLKFTLGGHNISLPPSSYVGQFKGKIPESIWKILHFKPAKDVVYKRCVPMLMGIDKKTQEGPLWILGLPFFRKFYTTFAMHPPAPSSTLETAGHDVDADPQKAVQITQSGGLLGLPLQTAPATMLNAVEKTKRKVYIAEADDKCMPTSSPGLVEKDSEREGMQALTIDATKIRVPPWLEKLADADLIKL